MKSRLASYSFFIIGAIHNKHKRKNKFLQYMREGHAWGRFAARVQRVQRGVVAASPQIKKRGAAGAAGCVVGLWKKVLKMDRPLAGGFLSLTALRAEGCGIALSGDEYEVSVTGFTFSAIWHDMHSGD